MIPLLAKVGIHDHSADSEASFWFMVVSCSIGAIVGITTIIICSMLPKEDAMKPFIDSVKAEKKKLDVDLTKLKAFSNRRRSRTSTLTSGRVC